MGTINKRRRSDGTIGHTAQIRIKQKGKVVHTESKTFSSAAAANSWMRRREVELEKPDGIKIAQQAAEDPPLHAIIDRYISELEKKVGKTKTQVLRTIKSMPIAEMKASAIRSSDYVVFAQSLDVKPQTRMNYMSHLGAVVSIAKAAWDYPLDEQQFKDAVKVARKLGITKKGGNRSRRPTLDELDKLLTHFGIIRHKRKDSVPMQKIVAFAIFSTRRQEEITRVTWTDLDEKHSSVIVRDMKNPGEKEGNDVEVDLPPEALRIIKSMSKTKAQIFPYSTDAISASFTRACKFLGIEDLHFHDLRHDGISRLFEMDWTVAKVAKVSGHRSWSSLQRYTHIKKRGDKYENWPWLEIVASVSK